MIIKHERFMDVAFMTTTKLDLGHSIIFQGIWINLGQEKSYIIDFKRQNIEVHKSQMSQWSILVPKAGEYENLRLAKLEPLVA